MKTINIVLIEPQIPQNTGNIARTCAATGARLHLVEPLGFAIDDKKLKRAGLDYWNLLDITVYPHTAAFFQGKEGKALYYFTTKGKHLYSQVDYHPLDEVYLVFGREDQGLPEDMLYANPQSCVRLPMRNGLRSLNLSNTVAIGVYEVLRQWDFPQLQWQGQLTSYQWEDES